MWRYSFWVFYVSEIESSIKAALAILIRDCNKKINPKYTGQYNNKFICSVVLIDINSGGEI